jgi:phage gpG-like protein
VRSGGGVDLVLEPPIPFILRQSGKFRAALEDLNPLWDRFKPLMADFEERVWETGGFGEWPPLAQSTIRQKGSSEILVGETGDLRRSLTDPNEAAETSRTQMVWGTDVTYAEYHQEGGDVAGRPPQREVIPDPFPVEERRKFEAETVNFVNAAARRTWGRI